MDLKEQAKALVATVILFHELTKMTKPLPRGEAEMEAYLDEAAEKMVLPTLARVYKAGAEAAIASRKQFDELINGEK